MIYNIKVDPILHLQVSSQEPSTSSKSKKEDMALDKLIIMLESLNLILNGFDHSLNLTKTNPNPQPQPQPGE